MTTPLFSTYRQGENRVTATFLAVLQRLSLPNIDQILGALSGETSFSLVSFENQPAGQGSRPDAKIGTGPAIWIETKTTRNAVRLCQIEKHLASLSDDEYLLLLTPDDDEPKDLPDGVVWSNFRTLAEAIEKILEDEEEPPSEREAFLLRELVRMFRNDGLIDTAEDTAESRVLVIAARSAWPAYQRYSVYWTNAHRSFRPSSHLAFYADRVIQPSAPKVRSVIESLNVRRQEEIDALEDPQQKILANEFRKKLEANGEPERYCNAHLKFMFLSGPEDVETIQLGQSILNDKMSENDKPVPFTFGAPRYVTLESLKNARKTGELKSC